MKKKIASVASDTLKFDSAKSRSQATNLEAHKTKSI
jgi:hypothetical protein